MMTVVTRVSLKEGTAPKWDAAMRERLAAARTRSGWVGAHLLMPVDELNGRVIIGTWRTRADWDAWHDDPAFRETREQLAGLEATPSRHEWHEVIDEATREREAA